MKCGNKNFMLLAGIAFVTVFRTIHEVNPESADAVTVGDECNIIRSSQVSASSISPGIFAGRHFSATNQYPTVRRIACRSRLRKPVEPVGGPVYDGSLKNVGIREVAMRRIILLVSLLVCATLFVGCDCLPIPGHQPEITGFDSPDELAKEYLKVIETKDIEGLKKLIVSPEDLEAVNMKQMTKQHWTGYFTAIKRLFLSKNKDVLGHKLNFLSFRRGTEFKLNPDTSIFRGNYVSAEQPDGKRVSLEINMIVRTFGKYKILFLRYLHADANIGTGPQLEGGPQPDAQAGEQPPAAKPAEPAGDQQNLEELKKLFGE